MEQTQRRLGKLAPVHDSRTLKLANYLDKAQLPTPPSSITLLNPAMSFAMYLNDSLGDCTCAAMGHMENLWAYLTGKTIPVADADVLKAYEYVGRYIPGDPSTDEGADELTCLRYWRHTGVAGRKISYFAAVNYHDPNEVKTATWMFDGLYIGLALPITAQSQDVWDVVTHGGENAIPGSWGGHAVNVVQYDSNYVYIITWGAVKRMTWAFWDKYVEEAYAVVSHDDTGTKKHKNTAGFNFTQLHADLAQL